MQQVNRLFDTNAGSRENVARREFAWILSRGGIGSLAAFFLAYLTFCVFGLTLYASGSPLIWPAAGLLLAVLSMTKRERWWRVVLVAVIAETAALRLAGTELPGSMHLAFPIISSVEGIAGALILRWLIPQPWQRRDSRENTAYVAVFAIFAAFVGAAVAASASLVLGFSAGEAATQFSVRWFADLVGILLVGLILSGVGLSSAVPAGLRRKSQITAGIVATLVLVAIVLLLLPRNLPSGDTYRIGAAALVFATVPFWIAPRLEPAIVAGFMFLTAIIIAVSAASDTSVLGNWLDSDYPELEEIQVIVVVISLAVYIRSLSAFEDRNVMRLIQWRQGSGYLIAKIATILSREHGEYLNAVLDRCLEMVGRHATADRCMIAQISVTGRSITETRSWVRPGISESRPLAQNLSLDQFGHGIELLLGGECQFLRRRDHDRKSAIGSYMLLTETRSAGFVPIFAGSEIIGTLGLAWVRRDVPWSNELLTTLRAIGELVGNAIARAQSDEIADRQRRKLRSLAQSLVRLDDQVRREISLDLHDGAAQSLAVARMKLGQCISTNGAVSAFEEIDELVSSALVEIRDAIDKMSPTVLYEFGLRAALQEYSTYATGQVGFDVTVDCSELTTDPVGDNAVFLYRAGRELVTNAIKHASATSIHIQLRESASDFMLRVEDDGVGINSRHYRPDTSGNTGYGLFSLDERASLLGGRIKIESNNSGTVVSLFVPKSSGET